MADNSRKQTYGLVVDVLVKIEVGVVGVPKPADTRPAPTRTGWVKTRPGAGRVLAGAGLSPPTLTEKRSPLPLSAATLFLSRRAHRRRDATFLRAPRPLPLPLQPQPSSSPVEAFTATTLPSSESLDSLAHFLFLFSRNPLPLPPSLSPPRRYHPPSPSLTSSYSSAASPQPSSSPAEPLTAATLPSSEPLAESSSAEQ
nr:vegetative cell wall protein gp1-like [Arachis hypogaea]